MTQNAQLFYYMIRDSLTLHVQCRLEWDNLDDIIAIKARAHETYIGFSVMILDLASQHKRRMFRQDARWRALVT